MSTPRILTLNDVLALHHDVMTRMGQTPATVRGADGLALLEGALARPQHAAFYAGADVFQQAALLVIGIAQAQAFVDGNHRTATAVMAAFLELAGLEVREGAEMDFASRLAEATEASGAAREMTANALAVWLRESCEPLPQD